MKKQRDNNQVKEITDTLEKGIGEIFQSEQYKEYLKVMSRFHRYSLNNTILISMQRPDASLVAGYKTWEAEFSRHVKKGEKAIRILAPSTRKIKVEVEKRDPVTGRVVLKKDGSPEKETIEKVCPSFRGVSVFDIGQTEGKDLPSFGVDELTGSVEHYASFISAVLRISPCPVDFAEIEGTAKGYFSPSENRIVIRKDMSEVQTIKTLLHEMAHATLHGKEPDETKPSLTRSQKEVEAESVAFTVCSHFGMDTSDYSFFYIAGWSSGKDTAELKASLDTIRVTAGTFIETIENTLRRERELREEIGDLARELDRFAYRYDTYEYLDSVEDPEIGVETIRTAVLEGDVADIREWLIEAAENEDLPEERTIAKKLLSRLDQITSGHSVQTCEGHFIEEDVVVEQKKVIR